MNNVTIVASRTSQDFLLEARSVADSSEFSSMPEELAREKEGENEEERE